MENGKKAGEAAQGTWRGLSWPPRGQPGGGSQGSTDSQRPGGLRSPLPTVCMTQLLGEQTPGDQGGGTQTSRGRSTIESIWFGGPVPGSEHLKPLECIVFMCSLDKLCSGSIVANERGYLKTYMLMRGLEAGQASGWGLVSIETYLPRD